MNKIHLPKPLQMTEKHAFTYREVINIIQAETHTVLPYRLTLSYVGLPTLLTFKEHSLPTIQVFYKGEWREVNPPLNKLRLLKLECSVTLPLTFYGKLVVMDDNYNNYILQKLRSMMDPVGLSEYIYDQISNMNSPFTFCIEDSFSNDPNIYDIAIKGACIIESSCPLPDDLSQLGNMAKSIKSLKYRLNFILSGYRLTYAKNKHILLSDNRDMTIYNAND